MSTTSSTRFLPDPQRRGEIHFAVARSLPYTRRLLIIAVLLVLGFAVQATLSLLAGAVLLLAASILAIVKGFSNIPDQVGTATEWRGATRQQLENVLHIAARSRRWDQSALDITCGFGVGVLVFAAAVVALVSAVLLAENQVWLAVAWALDCIVLLLPHWLTGVRRVLTNDPLVVKVRLLLMVMEVWERDRREGESIHPQMQLRKGPKGEMPGDAKLVLRSEKLGDAFLGLQVQVTLNRVQGSDFPYLYCVLVARPALRIAERVRDKPPRGIAVEIERNSAENVDVVVIRQQTTKKTGYHTNPAAGRALFEYALYQSRLLEPAASSPAVVAARPMLS